LIRKPNTRPAHAQVFRRNRAVAFGSVSEPSEPQRARRIPLWSGEFARASLANAVGTLMAALVLFLGGVIFGAIKNVPTDVVIAAIAALVALGATAILSARLASDVPRRFERRRQRNALRRPFERMHSATQRAQAEMGDGGEVQRLIDLAKAAQERGDLDDFDRYLGEAQRRAASAAFAVDVAQRYWEDIAKAADQHGGDTPNPYLDEFFRIAEEHGIEVPRRPTSDEQQSGNDRTGG
jgi:hypothetical protein